MNFIFVALFALLAVAHAQKEHCFDAEFNTQAVAFDPSRRYDDFHHTYFSKQANAMRVDVHEFEPRIRRVSTYLRFDLGAMYVMDHSEHRCFKSNLKGHLEPFCLSKRAHHDHSTTIGGSLKAEVYSEHLEHGNSLRIIFSSDSSETPINVFTRHNGHHSNRFFEEFFNWEHKVDKSHILDLPNPCKNLNQNSVLTADMENIVKKVMNTAIVKKTVALN